ncbi:MAG: substrate-binding domain-containing protein [Coriobacteriales bacterium]|nr:substrate-binding domain-containing protein [Coriobacteriales bacterium]
MLACTLILVGFSACGNAGSENSNYSSTDNNGTNSSSNTSTGNNTGSGTTAASGSINVVSREDGSGTRSAFVELFEVQAEKDGKKIDATATSAVITNSTAVMLTNVASDPKAIGYISLGSLDKSVKALKVDGAEATAANVKSGSYKISRPFNVATKGDMSLATQDFLNFILSAEGQKVVGDNHYIAIDDKAAAYKSNGATGKVVVAGSSSVTPVMEKLKEAYATANPNVSIEMNTSDSTTGMQSTIDGICDIGMASRELKDSETSAGLKSTKIAIDGIAVIVNNGLSLDSITKEQVRQIFLGELTNWSEIK